MAPAVEEIHRRMGNFIISEDDASHESVVRDLLAREGGSLCVAEDITGGLLAQRLSTVEGAGHFFRRGLVALDTASLAEGLGLSGEEWAGAPPAELASGLARAAQAQGGTSHGLCVTGQLDGPPRGRAGHMTATTMLALATPDTIVTRSLSLTGNRDWLAKGAAETGLDVVRRHLMGLPVDEKTDFELRDTKPGG